MSEMSEYDMDAIYHEVNPSTNLKCEEGDVLTRHNFQLFGEFRGIVLAISVLMSF